MTTRNMKILALCALVFFGGYFLGFFKGDEAAQEKVKEERAKIIREIVYRDGAAPDWREPVKIKTVSGKVEVGPIQAWTPSFSPLNKPPSPSPPKELTPKEIAACAEAMVEQAKAAEEWTGSGMESGFITEKSRDEYEKEIFKSLAFKMGQKDFRPKMTAAMLKILTAQDRYQDAEEAKEKASLAVDNAAEEALGILGIKEPETK